MPHSSKVKAVKRYARNYPSFFQGTYTEFTGAKQLPKALQDRPTVFIFGDDGVGKTILARHLLQDDFLLMRRQEVLDSFLSKVRKRRWTNEISSHPKLILESPSFLRHRPQILKMLQSLIALRTKKGLRTILLDSEDWGPVREVVQSIPIEDRATIMLRFPAGRGRYRFLAHVCRERNIPVQIARELSLIEPWDYKTVFAMLDAMSADESQDSQDSGEYVEPSTRLEELVQFSDVDDSHGAPVLEKTGRASNLTEHVE